MKNPKSDKYQSAKNSDSIHQAGDKLQAEMTYVFIHGWGMNSAIWQPFIEKLPVTVRSVSIDLPGHGRFNDQSFVTLDDLTQHLLQQTADIDQPVVWVGWSLGVLPILQLAKQQPARVSKIFALASNPRFVSGHDWAAGVGAEVFDLFAENLKNNTEKTLQRFLSLQVQGAKDMRELLRHLRQTIAARGLPSADALNAGLNVLKTTDMRQELSELGMPVSWVLGEKDTLVPAVLQAFLSEQPGLKSHIISGAAHLPFISHAEEVQQLLTEFINA